MNNIADLALVVIETDGRQAKPASLRAIPAARQLQGSFSLVCLGHQIDSLASSLAQLGAKTVYAADHESLADPLADRFAQLVVDLAVKTGAMSILSTSSTFSRDLLPRVAALLDVPMLSDLVRIDTSSDRIEFTRPVNAGSELATVVLEAERRVLTIRPGAFEMPDTMTGKSPLELVPVEPDAFSDGTRFVSRDKRRLQRPELSEARVVVAGGRPIKDRNAFEQLVGGLADVLGGAVGATRALVDAGVVPNDWQIGQTGKVLAPDLYIAMGISGSVQHLAGVMDARVIVAINTDPAAPMMKVASYALVGDLYEIVPQFIRSLEVAG